MDDLIDAIVSDQSPADVSDKIKELLFAKSAERIDAFRPMVAQTMFGEMEEEESEEE
jgi:hypothetical protein